MKRIELENKTVEIKTTLEEISIDQFERCMIIFKNKYESPIDQYIDTLQVISNLSKEEIEELELSVFENIITEIQFTDFSNTDLKFIDQIEIEGVIYKSTAKDNDYKFKVKEMFLLENIIKKTPDNYVTEMAAIIFREVDENGNIKNDYSHEGIERRKKAFLNNLSMNVIAPYVSALSKYFAEKHAVSNV